MEEGEKEIFIDPIIKEQLGKIKKKVNNYDEDYLLIVDGEEGTGKSVLALQFASYLDPNFSIDNVVFNAEGFMNAIKSAKKGSCIVLDEGFNSANSRATMSAVNRSIVGMATEMRQANLFVIIVLPSFFDLDKYFAIWRARSLIHVYRNKQGARGQYRLWPKKKKLQLYLNGKKMYSYARPKSPYPPMRFFKTYPIDELAYRQKKADAFRKKDHDPESTKFKGHLLKFIAWGQTTHKISGRECARIIGVDEATIRTWKQSEKSKS